ncbi:hypothetical protein B0H13DRAFT_1872651 [Mycena leptocephala]|nr:hypothetical protein B0H13DRAFT_1872651 [Mycena leptocephala]
MAVMSRCSAKPASQSGAKPESLWLKARRNASTVGAPVVAGGVSASRVNSRGGGSGGAAHADAGCVYGGRVREGRDLRSGRSRRGGLSGRRAAQKGGQSGSSGRKVERVGRRGSVRKFARNVPVLGDILQEVSKLGPECCQIRRHSGHRNIRYILMAEGPSKCDDFPRVFKFSLSKPPEDVRECISGDISGQITRLITEMGKWLEGKVSRKIRILAVQDVEAISQRDIFSGT